MRIYIYTYIYMCIHKYIHTYMCVRACSNKIFYKKNVVEICADNS